MLSTTILVSVLVAGLAIRVLLWAAFLRLGLRWAKAEQATMRRIAIATVLVFVIQYAVSAGILAWTPASNLQVVFVAFLHVAATVLVPCLVIQRVFRISFFRSAQTWIVTWLASGIAILLALFVLRPFIFETFTNSTNGMAPTLLGRHCRSTCPKCGQPSYCSPLEDYIGFPHGEFMICQNYHIADTANIDPDVHASDRFLAAKFLMPDRWDIVVFQYPEDPSTQFVMRVVGLPGETIHLAGGRVWVNGREQQPPDSLRGIEYVSESPIPHVEIWGTKERPAVLGEGEYFVLGDFSARSKDSRFWQEGAPGHPPYAVPKSHLRGVVTHIYWPHARWRVFR